MLNSPHLAKEILYNVSRWWRLYLNMCMDDSSSEDLGYPRETRPFYFDLIILLLEGGSYVGIILLAVLVGLVIRKHGVS